MLTPMIDFVRDMSGCLSPPGSEGGGGGGSGGQPDYPPPYPLIPHSQEGRAARSLSIVPFISGKSRLVSTTMS